MPFRPCAFVFRFRKFCSKCFFLWAHDQASTKEEKSFHRAPTERSICYKTSSGPETKNNSTRSERQPNTLLSYPKRAESKRQLCRFIPTLFQLIFNYTHPLTHPITHPFTHPPTHTHTHIYIYIYICV